jgi:glyoxylate/hydroxypyruvate reductase
MSAFLFVTPSWDANLWARHMKAACPKLDVRIWPDIGNPNDIDYVAAWLPPGGVLKSLPNLKIIFSLGAGVDAILSDATLPALVPIVRVNDPDLTMRMSEYIVLHVLLHHRQQRKLDHQQAMRQWNPFATHAAQALTVGIMGLGVLGSDAATKLSNLGFSTIGWSRTKKSIAGIKCFAGELEFDAFLNGTDILVSLLPATPQTDGLINYELLKKLSRQGPFGAPILVNAGRGRQNNEDDILQALNDDTLYAATLDVFNTEPLPQNHPFWSHPKLTLTPHIAADSDPEVICRYVSEQITTFEKSAALSNVVDRSAGY